MKIVFAIGSSLMTGINSCIEQRDMRNPEFSIRLFFIFHMSTLFVLSLPSIEEEGGGGIKQFSIWTFCCFFNTQVFQCNKEIKQQCYWAFNSHVFITFHRGILLLILLYKRYFKNQKSKALVRSQTNCLLWDLQKNLRDVFFPYDFQARLAFSLQHSIFNNSSFEKVFE